MDVDVSPDEGEVLVGGLGLLILEGGLRPLGFPVLMSPSVGPSHLKLH